jgi:hypothetical protein
VGKKGVVVLPTLRDFVWEYIDTDFFDAIDVGVVGGKGVWDAQAGDACGMGVLEAEDKHPAKQSFISGKERKRGSYYSPQGTVQSFLWCFSNFAQPL